MVVAGGDVEGEVYVEQNAGGTGAKVRVTGNRLPYAPSAMLTTTVGGRHPSGIDLRVESVRVSEQFGDPLNAPVFATGARPWLAVKKLTDRTVVVDRSRGLLPGLPRVVQLGFERGW